MVLRFPVSRGVMASLEGEGMTSTNEKFFHQFLLFLTVTIGLMAETFLSMMAGIGCGAIIQSSNQINAEQTPLAKLGISFLNLLIGFSSLYLLLSIFTVFILGSAFIFRDEICRTITGIQERLKKYHEIRKRIEKEQQEGNNKI